MRHLLASTALLLLLAAVSSAALSGARPGDDWGEAWIAQWELSLRVPGGWQLDCPLQGDTTRIYSPQGTEVLLRVWSGQTALTAAEAAAEYEQSLGLGDTVDPPPQPLRCAGGLQGVWVELNGGSGDRPLLALAVFSAGTRRVALSVRGLAGYEDAARQRLEAIAASLQVAAGSGVPPPSAAQGSPVLPPPPPLETPPPLPTSTVTSGAFTLAVPAGGKASVDQGTVWVETPQGGSGYFLWPARGGETDLPLGEAPAVWARQAGVELVPLMSRAAGAGTLVTATLKRGERVRALLYAWREGDSLLLAGICAPPAGWTEQAPRLAQWLAAAQCSGWRSVGAALPPTPRTWADAAGELSLRLPENWTARGGVVTYQEKPVIALAMQGDDTVVSWRQPYTPAFRDLTPVLQAMGQAEGTKYREGEEEDHLLVLARRAPDKFVEWLLQQPDEEVREGKIVRAEKSAAVAGLLLRPEGEPEGAVVCVTGTRGGKPREAVYLCATAALPLDKGAFRWQAAVLSVDYPPGQARRALAALRAILAGAAAVRVGSGAGELLAPAIRAAAGAAAEVAPPSAGHAPWALLNPDYLPAAPGQAPQWDVAPGLAAWRALVEKRETALPELAEGPWEERNG